MGNGYRYLCYGLWARYLSWLAVMTFTATASCDRQSKIYTTAMLGITADDSVTAGSLAISLAVIDDLKLALTEGDEDEKKMTPSQAHIVASGALAGLTQATSNTSLRLNADFYAPELAIPRLTGAAIKSLRDPRAGQSESGGKLRFSGVISESIVNALGNTTAASGLSDTQKKQLPGGITKSAVSNLENAGLEATDISKGIEKVMTGAVSKLQRIGFQTGDLQTVVSTMTKDTVQGMKDLNLDDSMIGDSMTSLVEATVGSLDEAGVSPTDVGGFVGPIMTEAVGGLNDLGLVELNQMATVVGSLVSSSVLALKSAGVKEVKDVSGVLKNSMQGAMSGMKSAGVETRSYASFVDDMMQGAVGSLDDIGLGNAEAIKTISTQATADTISSLQDFEIKDASTFKDISACKLSAL